jgi:ferredoxin
MPDHRKIIEIDEELCDGCGQCILACAEGALQIIDGKARLVGDIYCDGLGACLGECPQGALHIIERPAEAFDEQAVEELLSAKGKTAPHEEAPAPQACGCPGTAAMSLKPKGPAPVAAQAGASSQLGHWPVKLQLLNPQAPYLKDADLVLLADCAACAIPDLHPRYLAGNVIAMACPKLDDAETHAAKLAQVLAGARPRSIKVVHMEVPCCKGLEWIAAQALKRAGLDIPVESVVIDRKGGAREDLLPAAAIA